MKKYITSKEISIIWGVSDRTVRDYCNKGRIVGAILEGKKRLIPNDAKKPKRSKRHFLKKETLLDVLIKEKGAKLSGGIYHKFQIAMTYNSNHIEGSILSEEETKYIFETRTIGCSSKSLNIDDIIETSNHFRCIDLAIDAAKSKLSESLIKEFHLLLKSGTSDSFKSWFKVGDYKIIENEVGGVLTAKPSEVKEKIKELLNRYNSKKDITIYDIIKFHYEFEIIHPFQDGNGRVGRLIMLKECLKHNIVPILILDKDKLFYYRGLLKFKKDDKYLIDTCLNGQDIMKKYLDTFNIKYND